MTTKPLVPLHEMKGFDARRAKLRARIKILSAFTGFTRRAMAVRLGVDPSLVTHILSGRRNRCLGLYIEDMEQVVDEAEADAKARGVRLPS